ncbi:alpha/beta hydrolase [Streptomyces sp. WAC06614]|uniref:alpha/beta hydrolase n=1 Tax=Streptomyces sp. WAC06614 TaxID=2487416 RepID=UPI000F77406B|nr:alpha/beta hydrolase [Streptomyces sp. WAC06614]RSS66145.1 hypothetical protein EF918_29665 [Streptomyces sp. WAC06614]
MRRIARTLAAAVLAVTAVAGTAGWASAGTQTAVTGPPPGAAGWRSDQVGGRPLPDPATASPYEVARFFAGLDGAPVGLRYEANRLAVRATGDPRFAGLAAPGRQILAFDPRGRGQVAEVFGDLERSAHVAVVVPGSDNDAAGYDAPRAAHSGPGGMARSLRAATGDRAAVVAWTGYTTPVGVGLDAASGRLAAAGAERLTRFTQGLDAVGAADPALFCHSYGSVVCGLAASRLDARDLVVLGSPGLRAPSVAGLRTGARVWAAKGPSDWIDDVPNVELAGLGHGPDPTAPAFGARRVPASDVRGHTGYFAPGTTSLAAFAAIATGETR